MFPKIATAVLISLLIAGCADLRWHKPGTDSATLDRDLERCQKESRLQASREVLPRLATAPIITTDPKGHAIAVQPQPNTDGLLLEQDLTRMCMRKHGYELVPADQAVKK